MDKDMKSVKGSKIGLVISLIASIIVIFYFIINDNRGVLTYLAITLVMLGLLINIRDYYKYKKRVN